MQILFKLHESEKYLNITNANVWKSTGLYVSYRI